MQYTLYFILVFALVGCASSTRQTDNFFASPTQLPRQQRVEGVPFINQEVGQCGPATLTMAMNWAGKMISVAEVTPQVYLPSMKGSLQTDMISATRRQGLLAIPIEGLPSLLTEVAAGHPVIIFENLALSWLPQWHYAIVFGYDLDQQTILMHSGPEANKSWDMKKFERSWKLGDYWGLLVLPTNRLAKTADELAHATAAAALEQIGKRDEAATAYMTILKRWPTSLPALIGLGNWAYHKKEFARAVTYLKQAVKNHPESTAAKHNLAVAQAATISSPAPLTF